MKGGEFLDRMSNHHLPKKDSATEVNYVKHQVLQINS